MRRSCIVLIALVMITLTVVGCGASDSGVTEDTAAVATSTTQDSVADATTTTVLDTATSTTQPAAPDQWTTIAALHSTDTYWQGMEGILMSQPFTISGEARLVLDMPDAGELDGVIAAVLSADEVTDDPMALIDAIQAGVVVVVPAAIPIQVISGLDGTYVLVNSVPTPSTWSLELQTRP